MDDLEHYMKKVSELSRELADMKKKHEHLKELVRDYFDCRIRYDLAANKIGDYDALGKVALELLDAEDRLRKAVTLANGDSKEESDD